MSINKLMAVFLVLFIISVAFCKDDEVQGPRMTFAEKNFDFGEIISGEVVDHVYAFQNTGTDTLRIATVYSS
jgi:hypothetical protein